jgi:hypothetical protein
MTMTTPQDGQVLYCKQAKCLVHNRLRAATVLVGRYGNPGKPACEECARFEFDLDISGTMSVSPLSEYVDMYQASRQAAFAVPGDIIDRQPAPSPALTIVAALISPSPALGRPAQARKPMSKTAKTGWAALASIILGIIFFIAGAEANTPGAEGTPGAPLIIIGVLLTVLPLLIGAVFIAMLLSREISRDIAKERAWKATLTPQQRLGVQAAETAALYATWAGVHHWVKESNAKSAAAYQERSAQTRASMAVHQQQAQQAQMAAGLHAIAAQRNAAPRYDPSRITDRLNSGPARNQEPSGPTGSGTLARGAEDTPGPAGKRS